MGLLFVVSLLCMVFWALLLDIGIGVLSLHGLYIGLICWMQFPRYLYTFRYQTTIYFFSASIICAAMATNVVYKQAIRRDLVMKQTIREKVLGRKR